MFNCGIIESKYNEEITDNISELKKILSVISKNLFLLLLQDSTKKFSKKTDLKIIKEYYYSKVNVISDLAREFSLYLSSGLLTEVDQNDLFQSCLLFNPDGEIILKQRQIYLKDKKQYHVNRLDNIYSGNQEEKTRENGLKIKAGNTINYADTELGKIGLMLGGDCWYPQIGRVMTLEGVDLVLAVNNLQSVKGIKSINKPWKQLSGVWSQVQQNQFIALEACFGGQNLIHAPCEITPYRTGILAPVGSQEKARQHNIVPYFDDLSRNYKEVLDFKIVSAEISIDSLKEIRDTYPLMKYLNKILYCKEMGGIHNVEEY